MYAFFKAEAVRFELTVPCGTTVFKTVDLNHSSTLPGFTLKVYFDITKKLIFMLAFYL